MLSWNRDGGHVEVARNVRSLTMHDTCYVVKSDSNGGTFQRDDWVSASFMPDAEWLEAYDRPRTEIEARTIGPITVIHYSRPYQLVTGHLIQVVCAHPDVDWAAVDVPGIGTVPMRRSAFEVLTDVAKYALTQ